MVRARCHRGRRKGCSATYREIGFRPEAAHAPGDLIVQLRKLKEWSGLTYRQVESRARANGDHLARSTVAAVLSRAALPRHEFVAAYARACGHDPGPWLEARRRLAVADAGHPRPDDDPAGDTPAAAAPPEGPPRPDQVPPDIADFTGRGAQVERLCAALTGAAVPIAAIAGMGGVGKTALAVHVAHRLAGEFPSGRLYADLRGGGADPADPAQVLAHLLVALRGQGTAVPESTEERIALFRSSTAGRRILLVLDDAASEQQVRPLLPGGTGCAVLVTGRTRLSGLESATHIDLDVFEPEQSLLLLRRIIGGDRVGREPDAAAAVARLCAHAPLAVRIAGARLAGRPQWPVTRMRALLSDERRRLDQLVAGDLGVRASFALSYAGLPADAQRAFRLIGLLDTPDLAAWTVAALADSSQEWADHAVEALVDAHLLHIAGTCPSGEMRYRMHDLVRVFAREQAEAADPEDARAAALDRAFGAWLRIAEQAADAVPGPCYALMHGTAPRWEPPPHVSAALLARPTAFFDAEWRAVAAAVAQACELGRDEAAWDLAACMERYFDVRGMFDEWRWIHGRALTLCRRTANLRGQAVLLRGLADFSTWTTANHSGEAMDALRRRADDVLAMFTELGDRRGISDAQAMRTWSAIARGDIAAARSSAHDALRRAEEADYLGGRARAHHTLAIAAHGVRDIGAAVEHLTEALALARALGNPRFEATALQFLGAAYAESGRYEEGRGHLLDSLRMSRAIDDRYCEAFCLVYLARLHLRTGGPDAGPTAEAAARLSRQYGMNHHLADSLALLGEARLAEGRVAESVGHLEESVGLWRTRGWYAFLAGALRVLGRAYAADGSHEAARRSWDEARALFTGLGDTESAAEVAALPTPHP